MKKRRNPLSGLIVSKIMIDLSKLFDPYSRQARLYPALLTILPATVTVLAWFPNLSLASIGGVLVTLAGSCGLLFLLADTARTRGKEIEPKLLRLWGGWPTTIWLRYSDAHLPRLVKDRYHAFLSERANSGKLPTADEEKKDPSAADEVYDAAVFWLREQTRGDPLVEKENATYGFRRNLLGLKPMGLPVGLAALLGSVVATVLFGKTFRTGWSPDVLSAIAKHTSPALIGAMTFALLACVGWLTVVRSKWVRAAGDQYARALLAYCDKLPAQPADITKV
jgi:hypothetical protein